EAAVPLFVLCGRFEDARRIVAEYIEETERFSAHHRMHGVAMTVEVAEISGDWDALRALIPRTRASVADNLTTPCVRNSRSLRVCAAASAAAGDEAEALALEAEAAPLAAERYAPILAAPRIRLALRRGDAEAARELLLQPASSGAGTMWWYPGAVAA